ncbi:MAG: D-alanyl-D-alanine carboxypeptidase family protein [Erythrobacter sp.]
MAVRKFHVFLLAIGLALGLSGPAISQTKNAGGLPSEDEAPIALLIDMSSGQVLHARDPDRRFAPASMTKAMTLLLAFSLLDRGELNRSELFRVDEETWQDWNGQGSTMWLPANSQVSVDDLLLGIATVSANDGSIALAKGHAGSVRAWTEAMNAHARSIGLSNSHFGTPNGWPDEGRTFTTARDLTTLAQAMMRNHPEQFSRYVGRTQFTFNGITQDNRDPMIGRVAGANGIKTGYTNESGYGFLGAAKRNGQQLIMVVGGTESQWARANIARRYMEWGFSAFDSKPLFAAGVEVATARVQGGSSRTIALVTDQPVFVNVPAGANPEVSVSVRYDGPIRAPFDKGKQVGSLNIQVEGMEPANVPLYVTEAVGEANLIERIFNAFAGWFS